jgi:hypothetical protein
LFEFGEVDDMRRVLDGRPWSYDRHMLVLTEFDGSIPPMQMKFVHSPFWIQVHDMPLLCMTKSVGEKIANSLGTLEEVDVAGSGVGWGRCLRLRVVIDISKPLERGRALVLNGNTLWVNFKYEKLPLFCFACGHLVHGDKGCPERRSSNLRSGDDINQWGVWNQAEDPWRRGVGGSHTHWTEGGRNPSGGAEGTTTGGGVNCGYSEDRGGQNVGQFTGGTNERQGAGAGHAKTVDYGAFVGDKEVLVEDVGESAGPGSQEACATTLRRKGKYRWVADEALAIVRQEKGITGPNQVPIGNVVLSCQERAYVSNAPLYDGPSRGLCDSMGFSPSPSNNLALDADAASPNVSQVPCTIQPTPQTMRTWKRRACDGTLAIVEAISGISKGKKRKEVQQKVGLKGGKRGKSHAADTGLSENDMVEAVSQPHQAL